MMGKVKKAGTTAWTWAKNHWKQVVGYGLMAGGMIFAGVTLAHRDEPIETTGEELPDETEV